MARVPHQEDGRGRVFRQVPRDQAAVLAASVAHGGHVATIIAGPGAGRGVRLSTRSDHYSILRLVEAAFGLDYLKKAASAPRITGYRR